MKLVTIILYNNDYNYNMFDIHRQIIQVHITKSLSELVKIDTEIVGKYPKKWKSLLNNYKNYYYWFRMNSEFILL